MTSLYSHDIVCFILVDYQTGLWEKYLVTGDWSQSSSLWTQLLIFLYRSFWNFAGVLVMVWRFASAFGVILPWSFVNFFHFFDLGIFFSGQIIIRIDTLWAQLLLDFLLDHFETMYTCSTWSVDAHVVLGLFSINFFYLFVYFFFQVQLIFEYISYGRNSSQRFTTVILKLCILVLYGL